tara:strand:- start:390 stop:857 length:468 start_codon:yes stop_codon:yes gene_type:complete
MVTESVIRNVLIRSMRNLTILFFYALVIVSCRKIPESSPSSSNLMVTGEPKLIPGHFWVAQFDFPEPMDYFQARTYAQALGPRWDLPSIKQAKVMMVYKDSLLEMNEDAYWIRLSSWSDQSSNNIGGSADILDLQNNEIRIAPIGANHFIRAIYR